MKKKKSSVFDSPEKTEQDLLLEKLRPYKPYASTPTRPSFTAVLPFTPQTLSRKPSTKTITVDTPTILIEVNRN